MAAIFGGKPKSTQQPNYTGVPIQTSVNSLPVPVGWGTFLTAGNLIWYGDFQKTTQSTQGGKGGSSGKGGGQTDYKASIMLALCEGPVTAVKVAEDSTSWESLSQAGLALIGGAIPQTAWSYLTAKYPSQANSYPGVALLVSELWDLGSSPQIPSNNVVLHGNLAGTASWASSGEFQTADMGLVIQDFLTNPRYGVRNFSSLDTTTLLSTSAATSTGDGSLQTYCRAMGWGFSPFISSVEGGLGILQRFLQVCNCDCFWSGSLLKFASYGTAAVTANGVTYLPNLTPVYSLGPDDFIADSGKDPVRVTRIDPYDVPNIVRVEVLQDDGYYSQYPVEARDQARVQALGERVGSTVTAHEIIGAGQGAALAHEILVRGNLERNTYEFNLDWSKCLLEPMDIVLITVANLGLTDYAVRITGVEEDDQCILQITAEDFPQGIVGPVEYETPTYSYNIQNKTQTADPINYPIIFEPPATFTGGAAEVWILLSGGVGGVVDPFWGGAVLYVSNDNVTYIPLGSLTIPARMGYTTAALASYSGANPDTVNTLTVSLAESDGELISASAYAASTGQTDCYVGGEIIGYETATLVGPNTYNLTGLWRGRGGSPISAHASGTQFGRTDDATYIYLVPDDWVGELLYFKATSFNIWGQGYEDLSTVTAYTYTPSGTAYIIGAPGSPTITPARTLQPDGSTVITLGFAWGASAGPLLGAYNLEWSTDGGATWPGTATTGSAALSYQFKPAVPSTNYLLRVQAVSQNGQAVSAWSVSASTNSGTLILSVPAAPYPLTAVPNTSGSVVIGWPANLSSDAVLSYQVYRANGAGAAFSSATLIWSGLATSFPDTGLTNGASYTYFVTATNSLGPSGHFSINATAVNVTGTGAYMIQGWFYGPLPSGSPGTTIYQQTIVNATTFPAGLTGSNCTLGHVSTSPTPCSIQIWQNSTMVGKVEFAAGTETPAYTFASDVTYAPGDIFALIMGTNDGGANFGYSFVGHA